MPILEKPTTRQTNKVVSQTPQVVQQPHDAVSAPTTKRPPTAPITTPSSSSPLFYPALGGTTSSDVAGLDPPRSNLLHRELFSGLTSPPLSTPSPIVQDQDSVSIDSGGSNKPLDASQDDIVNELSGEALLAAFWSKCDGGATASVVTRGAAAGSSSYINDQILVVVNLLPFMLVAQAYQGFRREHYGTYVAFCSAFANHWPEHTEALVALTSLSGQACMNAIDSVREQMFGIGDIHDTGIYAIMIYVWIFNPASKCAALVGSIVIDYLKTRDGEIPLLIAACEKGTTYNLDPALPTDPGLVRLNYLKRFDTFTSSWTDLWSCIVKCMSHSVSSNATDELASAISEWNISSSPHILIAEKSETVQSVVARHMNALNAITQLATRLGMPSRVPDDHERGINLLKAFNDRKLMIKSVEDQIMLGTYGAMANGVTFPLAVRMLTAEEARSAFLPTSIFAAVRSVTKSAAPPPRPDRKGSKGEKGGKSGKGDPGSKGGRGDPSPPNVESETDANGVKLLSLPFIRTAAQAAEWYDTGVCSNCGECNPKMPPHRNANCCYKRADGELWHKSHVACQEGVPLAPAFCDPAPDAISDIGQGTIEDPPVSDGTLSDEDADVSIFKNLPDVIYASGTTISSTPYLDAANKGAPVGYAFAEPESVGNTNHPPPPISALWETPFIPSWADESSPDPSPRSSHSHDTTAAATVFPAVAEFHRIPTKDNSWGYWWSAQDALPSWFLSFTLWLLALIHALIDLMA